MSRFVYANSDKWKNATRNERLRMEFAGLTGDFDWILRFDEAISTLTPCEKRLIKKRYSEGKTYIEIGADEGIGINQARQLVAMALLRAANCAKVLCQQKSPDDLSAFRLSTRAYRALRRNGYETAEDVKKYVAKYNGDKKEAIMRLRLVGEKTASEIIAKLDI